MATYAIGDIQGCYDELRLLLTKINFQEGVDQLWLVGDLVSRGPKSLEVLQYLYKIQDSCVVVLGNHDLHLLACYRLGKKPNKKDKLKPLFASEDCSKLLAWLQTQPIAYYDKELKTLMVHAGVPPQWDLEQTLAASYELESVLSKDKKAVKFFKNMYGNTPKYWSSELKPSKRLRFATNAMTRMRFCKLDGGLDMLHKGKPTKRFKKYRPWYEFKTDMLEDTHIVFGHWAALNGNTTIPNLYALDTGCVWGNKLTALRLEDKKFFQVKALRKWA